MAFKFLTKKGWHLRSANSWLLDGELLSGEVRNNTKAFAQTDVGPVPVTIKTVAFIRAKDFSKQELTLNIEQPICDVQLFEGKMLVAEDKTCEQEREEVAA